MSNALSGSLSGSLSNGMSSVMNSPFSLNSIPWDNRFLTMNHVERVWHKLYPVLPPWVYETTTIYAVYVVVAAMLCVFVICSYKTLELCAHAFLGGTTQVKGLTTVLLWDLILAYPIWFIWTA